MKYLLIILGLCLASIPFFIWEVLVTIWTFDRSRLTKLSRDVSESIESNYRRAFPYKPKKRTV